MADDHHEIIIIKRHGDHEDGHHGGAWKIALADFMTAMMALFLVLWLIGSTTKETKTAIAEYFNPVKLADVTFDRKGLRDPKNAPGEKTPGEASESEAKEEGKGEKGDGKGASKGAPGSPARESALFQDPYAVLARLAAEAEAAPEVASADAVVTEAGEPGVKGGDAARDPFDPLYWQVAPLARMRTDKAGATGTVAAPAQEARPDARAAATGARAAPPVQLASAEPGIGLPQPPKAVEPMPASVLAALEPAKAAKPATAPVSAPAPVPSTSPAESREARASKEAAEAAETTAVAEIKAEILKAVQPQGGSAPAPHAEVRRTGEGILISLTDDVGFSMFGVGSAEPQAKVVRTLEQVARILKDRPGRIVVRGHTDARPFRSETYDNWRLSSARAQMASYMLVRGGLPDARLERIEGYADRQPRNPADAKAAENRRIEILLRGRPE